MGFFADLLRRRAIRSYIRRLPRQLLRSYGDCRHYTPQQVKRGIERAGLNKSYTSYAAAMYCRREDFDAEYSTQPPSDYNVLRAEIAGRYFGGDADFSLGDIHAAAAHSGADGGPIDGGGSGDGGSGL